MFVIDNWENTEKYIEKFKSPIITFYSFKWNKWLLWEKGETVIFFEIEK